MQYPYFTFLEIITVVLTLLAGLTVFHFLVKRQQGNNFLTALKAFVLYMLGSIFVYLIYPFPLLARFLGGNLAKFLDFLIYSVILFLIFYLVTKKILLINWKRALILFLLLVMVTLPALSFLRTGVIFQATRIIPIIAEERTQLEAGIMEYFEEHGIGGLFLDPFVSSPSLPFALKMVGEIERATLSWPINYFRAIAITI